MIFGLCGLSRPLNVKAGVPSGEELASDRREEFQSPPPLLARVGWRGARACNVGVEWRETIPGPSSLSWFCDWQGAFAWLA
jgi:hypothetical protein